MHAFGMEVPLVSFLIFPSYSYNCHWTLAQFVQMQRCEIIIVDILIYVCMFLLVTWYLNATCSSLMSLLVTSVVISRHYCWSKFVWGKWDDCPACFPIMNCCHKILLHRYQNHSTWLQSECNFLCESEKLSYPPLSAFRFRSVLAVFPL